MKLTFSFLTIIFGISLLQSLGKGNGDDSIVTKEGTKEEHTYYNKSGD